MENSGSLPLSNNTFNRGDDLTVLLIGDTPTEFDVLFELERTVFRNMSEALLDIVGLLLAILLAVEKVTLVKLEDVVVMPLTVGTVSLC